MNRDELRKACKAAGIKGYGKMTVDQMVAALDAPKAPAAIEPPKAEPTAPPAPPAPPTGRICPACGIDVDDNGYDQNDTTGSTICLACEHEWGGTHKSVPVQTGDKQPRDKGAVRRVWDICDDHKDMRRKDVIQLCVDMGINYYTARTQYQAWFKATNDSNGNGK